MRLEDMHGRLIGRYEIKNILGRGGMAAVYRAHDTALRRDVALKVLYPQFGGDDSLIERFKREAVLAAGLDHPNIVPIYDVGESQPDGVVYIAMKLLNGRSLADLLREQPLLTPAALVPIIDQIASALDYAHQRGIVHRDIKSANIMLEGSDPTQPYALLTDFGIAKSLDSSGLTTSGVLIGTPDYMAPEQISQAQVDGRADIYALGVVAFRCLTGRRPFEGGTEQVLIGHLHGPIPDASMIESSLPIAVDPVIRKALAKRPEGRYGTAGEFAQALRAALGFEPLTPPPARRPLPDARAAIPGVAVERIARLPTSADAQTQQVSATDAPTRRASGPVAPRPERMPAPRPVSATQRRPAPAPLRPRSNSAPLLAITLFVVLVGAFALYRTFAAVSDAPGDTVIGSPVPALVATVSQPTNTPPQPTVAPPAPVPSPLPNAVATLAPTVTATAEPTVVPTVQAEPTSAPPTSAPPTVAPPTVAPPTVAPPTVAPPTVVPPTTAPPTAVPATAAPVACAITPDRGFGFLVKNNQQVRARLGCPTQNEVASSGAEQAFQRGDMLWFNSPNGEAFYVLQGTVSNDSTGRWANFTKDQVDAVKGRDAPPIDNPPTEALHVPRKESGFYYIWVHYDRVRTALGYALALNEGAFDQAAFQTYDAGTMLYSPSGLGTGPTIYVLYNDGTFERYKDTSPTAPN